MGTVLRRVANGLGVERLDANLQDLSIAVGFAQPLSVPVSRHELLQSLCQRCCPLR
ncbi:MAG: hypothetical protein U0Z70_18255 [Thermomicrobiales bacterium]